MAEFVGVAKVRHYWLKLHHEPSQYAFKTVNQNSGHIAEGYRLAFGQAFHFQSDWIGHAEACGSVQPQHDRCEHNGCAAPDRLDQKMQRVRGAVGDFSPQDFAQDGGGLPIVHPSSHLIFFCEFNMLMDKP